MSYFDAAEMLRERDRKRARTMGVVPVSSRFVSGHSPSQKMAKTAPQRPSLRKAVTAFCRWCIYDPGADGNWRQQVHACTATDCPLYQVRPLSTMPLGK